VERLREAVSQLRVSVDEMLATAATADKDQTEVLQAYRMFAHSRGWLRGWRRTSKAGLSAEAAVEKEQSEARARLQSVPDPYLRDRLHDLDDLSNRLLRILTGQGRDTGAEMPDRPILVARNIGPASCWTTAAGCAAWCWRRARSAAMPRSSPARWRSRW
jgi:phosphotransferase system, enzyme I, PtsP